MNKRIYVERKTGFQSERDYFYHEIKELFNTTLGSLRYLVIYDVFNITSDDLEKAITDMFTEPNRDVVFEDIPHSKNIIAIEALPGQFDQRADSATQCIKLINPHAEPIVNSGYAIIFDEEVDSATLEQMKSFYINKVESREKDLSQLNEPQSSTSESVPVIDGFITLQEEDLETFYSENGFAMSFDDIKFIQDYFINDEKRDPYETELKVLDTYWSDHCRHTTFETFIRNITFDSNNITKQIEKSFDSYLSTRRKLGITKDISLMNIATINAKLERVNGNLDDLEISEEVNACSIYIDVDVNGIYEKWLLMFKNETHNHPTEIEPFGGASTCIGGAIRDPLSGRSFVYGAMRITGAADVTAPLQDTLRGKLPQRVISKMAAHGYSSYGNQIGLPTTFVNEIYHPNYVAKRLEVGAVIGAVKADYVVREMPVPGDIIMLLGGKTGRDGIGGATGSSKTHNNTSIETASSEVQKGNAPEERKIQRLFRNPNVTKLIKKSNDFGAGGVSVAIGELADGIFINLDAIPTKYDGINGTELAISESQERMAVVIDKKDKDTFISYCHQENIETVEIAQVTEAARLKMVWKGTTICDIARTFIETSGVSQLADVHVLSPTTKKPFERLYEGKSTEEKLFSMLKDPNISSQQGLVEMFDSSIGRTTVLSPYGGKYKLTKTHASVQKIPVQNGDTNTVSIMAYGFNPNISTWSPYHGASYAVIDSIAKVVATGGDYRHIRFTFQEYFERLHKDPLKWGKPFAALLGAYQTLKDFSLAAIGGKDSMSGSYHEIDVPPTLISFAVTTEHIDNIISPEFKEVGTYLYAINHIHDSNEYPNINQLISNFSFIKDMINQKVIISASPVGEGGISEALIKSSFGNKIGLNITTVLPLFRYKYGTIIVESRDPLDYEYAFYLGRTIKEETLFINDAILSIEECIRINNVHYSEVYPMTHYDDRKYILPINKQPKKIFKREPINDVVVLNPVFPGTNCEYDTEAVFVREGATVTTFVFNNQTEEDINDSIMAFAEALNESHILMLSGGFSSGDEPDGSGKFIASVLKNKIVSNAISEFLQKKNLILGICNGFQALVKSGLLPYGEIKTLEEGDPTLFKNDINRHVAKFTNTKVSSTNSPWLSSFEIDDTHTIAMSHGEGKFVINEEGFSELVKNNQVAFQYVDNNNQPTYNPMFNINGSSYAIEGIVSKDGLILGKMGHSERYEKGLFKNIQGNLDQNIFKNAIRYFKEGTSK